MIYDPKRLAEVAEEISAWSLEKRREHIRQVGEAFGEKSAEQLRAGLTRLWQAKKTK